MGRAAIFINGKRISKKRVLENLRKSDTILCADGGVKHVLAYGLVPRVIIGDQDSTSKTIQKALGDSVRWVKHSPEKDFTDFELTVSYAVKKGFDEIVVFGLSGTRFDHVLANILYLSYHTKLVKVIIVEDFQTIYVLKKGSIELHGKKKQQVSLIPLDNKISGITTNGLKWELTNADLEFGKTIGVSNELVGGNAKIELTQGPLLVIHSLKDL